MHISENMNLVEKLSILSDVAKYDVACTSSGSDRQNDGTGIGNCEFQAGAVSNAARKKSTDRKLYQLGRQR